jgi:glyoxylase-like metal-dependent hydrolase (beta-lactamase superfamily II)
MKKIFRPSFIIFTLLLLLALIKTSPLFLKAEDQTPAYRVEEIAKGVYAVLFEQMRTNSGFIVGSDSVTVIDALINTDLANKVIGEVKKVTDKPIRYLVNTHFHTDHVSGNSAYPKETTIIAHRNTRTILEKDLDQMRKDVARIFKLQLPESFSIVLPNLTFTDKLAIHDGTRKIDILYMGKGHTAGDAVVYLPEEKIIFAGDLIVTGVPVFALGGFSKEYIDTLKKIEALDSQKIVSGHGGIVDKNQILKLIQYTEDLRTEVKKYTDAGKSLDETVSTLALAQYEGWPRHKTVLPFNVEQIYKEMKGEAKEYTVQ